MNEDQRREQTVDHEADSKEPSSDVASAQPPQSIGRYRVERVLGKGGFGLVYLALDDQLQRLVAIKVPHARLVAQATDAEAYLTEARTVAKLDHPNIVPVHDVGSSEQFPCYIVSKYIDGADLATRLKQDRLPLYEAVELVATVADALRHAHKHGVVHRDIKPGNILLDNGGKPFVGDFGLALREQDLGQGSRFVGTPAYMSPEQARGEGHRVDGRSDIFSLGVVFYELLTGRRPFKANSQHELIEQITGVEARPPRQIDDRIPKELDRICLKTLSKRASERYSAAGDMAEDLRHFLASASVEEKSTVKSWARSATDVATPTPSRPPTPSDTQPAKIVPKGLRSFDAADADFFLELLPGPRDRDGLPDSIRFWKARIETTDADNTFSVGLIYGPSGCGKSSLVKAGLLPRLAKSVTAVYVEATGEETEPRLLKGLRRQVPKLPGNLDPIESLAALRRGRFLESGQKVLLVLDQFEQWLHARRNEEGAELVQALRQCDGERLQCVVMVRDDFWLAVSRFMKATEVEILEGRNSALVDLFDPFHARKVLAAFGRAYGRLPDSLGHCSKEQDAFLDRAVAELAQEGKVISVRLALFAEMVKGKPWTSATLDEVGGTGGIGVTFLEETFMASTAPPQHRLHQKAAQAVLRVLLPEAGTDIKGHMRSRQELLEASGYESRSRDFDDLLRILDSEIRLITPTDPEGAAAAGGRMGGNELPAARHSPPVTGYFQLTHDYLVPSLRDWLNRKQKETRRGRAELLLADRAAVWNARPENRQLPSLPQWFQIRSLTARKRWTPPQRKMMSKAGRRHAVRGGAIAVVLALLGWGGYETHGTLQAHALRDRLLDANTADVPTIVNDMPSYRRWLDPLLRDAFNEAEANQEPRQQLHASLALLPLDPGQVDYLYSRLLAAEPHEVPVIHNALTPHKRQLRDKLWMVLEAPKKGQDPQRLRAASALAKYDPDSEKWATCSTLVVDDLVRENPVFLGQWSEAFRPVKNSLLGPLSNIFRDRRPELTGERNLATNLLDDYAADQPRVLANLTMDADEKQFAAIYPKFEEKSEQGLPVLIGEIDRVLPPDATDDAKEALAKRQANAAAALLKMNLPAKVWPLLKHSPDPRVRSYLIHRISPLGVDPVGIVHRLDNEADIAIRRALLLSLGEFGEQELSSDIRKTLLQKLQEMYRTEDDPGLHASVEWLLRAWKQEAWLQQANEEWAMDREQRDKRLDNIAQALAREKQNTPPQWYVNSQAQTLVVIPGPAEFMMGAPLSEAGRTEFEPQLKMRIGRSFALAAKSVTVEQYRHFDKDYYLSAVYIRMADLPVVGIDWYRAAKYCNWLSEEEGIPADQRCYNIQGTEIELKQNYLSLSGYRLPTEAEMEYATRAGAVTSRYFGETEDLLPKYAWYAKNSQDRTWPVGRLKPNDYGLFDSQGNVYTWCQESYKPYPQGEESHDDQDDEEMVDSTLARVLRGGSFNDQASFVRSSLRNFFVPTLRDNLNGFRPARTFPVGRPAALPRISEEGRN